MNDNADRTNSLERDLRNLILRITAFLSEMVLFVTQPRHKRDPVYLAEQCQQLSVLFSLIGDEILLDAFFQGGDHE